MSQKELLITMLGEFELGWRNGRFKQNFTSVVPKKNLALLGYLVLNPRLHQREELARLFWPDSNAALASLRVALNKLRGVGLEDYIVATRTHVGINTQANYWVDVQAFQTLIVNNRRNPEPDISALKKAVAIYNGEFLEGFSVADTTVFEEGIFHFRQQLDDMVWEALDAIIQFSMRETADYETGIQYAQRALAIAPWRETAYQYLMWLLSRTGQKAAALVQYERCREALKIYFDVEPSPETEELLEEIRNHEPTTKADTAPLPPLHTSEAEVESPFLAPLLSPLFVGRAEPLAHIKQVLTAASSSPRLGIVGMGGIGKTTLALHLAHALRGQFPDGVLWANVVDEQPEEIATQWAAAYSYDLSQQYSGEERVAVLKQVLESKKALLVLDDVWAGSKIRHLLPESGNCAVLITSRVARVVRSLDAEPVLLSQFSPENGRFLLRHYIDEERIQADPTAVAEICDLVGNLPLAISIAGSYLAYRPYRTLADFVAQLKQQIKPLDLVEDEQRIRETFELSWKYLDDTQSRLFSLLGLFGGRSFSLAAINEIAQIDQADIFMVEDRLQELVQLSLLRVEGQRRYRQHALLATFAEEKLGEAPSAKERYVSYFSAFAEAQANSYKALQPEWGNLDTAVKFAESIQQWEAVLRLTAVLKDAWFARGRFEQAREAFKIAFHAAVRLEDEPQLARNWLWWGQACLEQGDQTEARKWLQQALDLYDELEDGIGIADTEYELARLDIEQTLPEEAERRLNRVLALRQAHNDEKGVAATLYRFARLWHRQQNNGTASELAIQSADKQQQIGDQLGRCKTLRLLVFIMIGLKQEEVARQYAEESLSLAEELDNLGEIAMAKRGLAAVYRILGRLEEANRLAEDSFASLERMGDRQAMTAVRFLQCLIKRSEGKYEEALPLAEECLEEFTRLKDEQHVAYCLVHEGDIYNIFGERETAVQKWHAALDIARMLDDQDMIGKINGRLASNN